MTDEDIGAWREHPVTIRIRAAIEAALKARKDAIQEAFWAGRQDLEGERLKAEALEGFCEDLFEVDAEHVGSWLDEEDDD
jgi:hypothetical protein